MTGILGTALRLVALYILLLPTNAGERSDGGDLAGPVVSPVPSGRQLTDVTSKEGTLMFLHVWKCGGTTLRELMCDWAKRERLPCATVASCRGLSLRENKICLVNHKLIFPDVQGDFIAKQRVIAGHFRWGFQVYAAEPHRLVTTLRNPLELYASSRVARRLHRMNAVTINVLNTTGLVVVHKGWVIHRHIRQQGGFFRSDAVGDIVDQKSWIVPCDSDSAARAVATFLKKEARKAGLKANDSGRGHFKTFRKNVTKTEANTALVGYRLLQRQAVKDNRVELGKNFWPILMRFKEENVKALAVSPLMIAQWLINGEKHCYLLFFSGGYNGRTTTSFQLWDYMDREFEDMSADEAKVCSHNRLQLQGAMDLTRESVARELAVYRNSETDGAVRYEVDGDSDVEEPPIPDPNRGRGCPEPSALRARDSLSRLVRTSTDYSSSSEGLPLIVHPQCIHAGCTRDGTFGMVKCDSCHGALHRSCGTLVDEENDECKARVCSACSSSAKGKGRAREL
eukprot:g15736.t2